MLAAVFVFGGCDPEHQLPLDPSGDGSGNKGEVDPWENLEPTWASIYENVVVTTCLECHSSEGGKKPKEGLDMLTYESMDAAFTFPRMITPGNPEQSKLYLSIGEKGDMPYKRAKLPPEVVEIVRQWILNGAKEFED